jgi:hypothetical protein
MFQPAINLLLLMSTLSMVAERLANAIKLRHAELREPHHAAHRPAEKERERQIADRVLIVSLLLAAAVKADFFAIMAHLQAPWDTLGWTGSPALTSPWRFCATLAGTALTGVSLGFGSKFWHDMLDIVYGARTSVRHSRRPAAERGAA